MTWQQRRIDGLPRMTGHMRRVLEHLRDCKAQDWPLVHLTDVHKHTLNALVRRDWIFESPGLDGVRYTITARGQQALDAYSVPPRQYRYDGICPDCGERPVHITASGNSLGYCLECRRARQIRKYRETGSTLKPGGLCPRCQQRPRHTYASGHTIAYCLPCRNALRADERRRKHERLLARIAAGEEVLCIRCKQRPRYHTQRQVYDYCQPCYYQQQRAVERRRIAAKFRSIITKDAS